MKKERINIQEQVREREKDCVKLATSHFIKVATSPHRITNTRVNGKGKNPVLTSEREESPIQDRIIMFFLPEQKYFL